ncbi:hypothetical protein X777_13037 [Ooceraea biroi]|uniref:Uncharacterized protein n=1 Tax=Ooceraea biroi TaxID=2015173 RepID=A0A026WYJ2_OOCBI|nr:hypothetical protein X777_13037 [Ooceraea biroi]
MFTRSAKPASVPAAIHRPGYRDTLTVHNLNVQSEYYTMQPARRERERKEEERGERRNSFLPLCSFHRLQISEPRAIPCPCRSAIFRSKSSSPVIDTCAHSDDTELACSRDAS